MESQDSIAEDMLKLMESKKVTDPFSNVISTDERYAIVQRAADNIRSKVFGMM